jgi:hypothetical protein
MNLKFSHTARVTHHSDRWNPETIKEIMDNHQVSELHFKLGESADVMWGYAPDGACVGLVLSKRNGQGDRIIVTGHAADASYWKSL